MMEDCVVYDAQECTLEVSVVQSFCGQMTTTPGSTRLFYNVAFIAKYERHIREENLVLHKLSELFYGSSSNEFFVFCDVYQTDDGEILLVVGEGLWGVDTSWVCKVYTATEAVVEYLKSL